MSIDLAKRLGIEKKRRTAIIQGVISLTYIIEEDLFMHYLSRLLVVQNCFIRFTCSNISTSKDCKDVLSDVSKKRCIQKISKLSKEITHDRYSHLTKKAAVLVPLCEVSGIPSILFTQRAHGLRKSRSEVCFPGGIKDDEDESLISTALRETEEEIGLSLSSINVWTTMPALPDYNFTTEVHGVLGNVGEIVLEQLPINPNEVARVFAVPIAVLADPKYFGITHFRIYNNKRSKWDYTAPVYVTEPQIWGLTASFVNITLSTLLQDHELCGSLWDINFSDFKSR